MLIFICKLLLIFLLWLSQKNPLTVGPVAVGRELKREKHSRTC